MENRQLNWVAIATAAVALVALVFVVIGTFFGPSHPDVQAVHTATDSSALAMVQANTETLRGEFRKELEAQKKSLVSASDLNEILIGAGLVPKLTVPDTVDVEVSYSYANGILVVPQPPAVLAYCDSVNAAYAPKAQAKEVKKAEPGKPAEAQKPKSKTDFSKIM